MDIRSKAVSVTGRLELRDATDELMLDNGKPVVVAVYGPGSKEYAAAQAKQSNRLMNRMKAKGKVEQTAEQARAEQSEFLTDITVSFENLEYDDLTGAELARAVYTDASIGFIADQVATFVRDWANFSSKSATK